MSLIEILHTQKKKIVKFWNCYFSVNEPYTCVLPDKIYLKKLYKKRMGTDLELRNPITFCEKLNWLKLYDRKPEYTMMADKYAVRDYVKERVGEEYLIPLIGVWDSVEEIDYYSLPNQFVLKCNHDNGVIICKDKSAFDVEKAKKELLFHYNRNYYKKLREWSYKNIEKKIICEKYMSDDNQPVLNDYKFFCFNGKVKALFIATDRPVDTRFDFFDREFNHLPIINGHPNSDKEISKPKQFNKMIEIAEKLSFGIPHVRVDLYVIKDRIYFGEMTLIHYGGFTPLEPEEWEYTFGEWLVLPKKRRR